MPKIPRPELAEFQYKNRLKNKKSGLKFAFLICYIQYLNFLICCLLQNNMNNNQDFPGRTH